MRRPWRRIPCIRLSTILTPRRCCASRGCKLNGPRRRHMSTLAGRKCRPLPAGTPALSRARIDALLTEVPGWTYDGKVIAKSWSFKNYYETLAFVNAVAWLVHREDHHPDMSVGYNRCRVEFSTHSIGGISENDFICAAKIEALASI
ncbi:MAG: 4a-hydroxytetrahydrobiopterin dehydratase [Betaproteobacteria bacterium]|nr:MAG: 4a-hydroxytetrahydrobiopterin dehydratase [Betaproteobacteria bacterium]